MFAYVLHLNNFCSCIQLHSHFIFKVHAKYVKKILN